MITVIKIYRARLKSIAAFQLNEWGPELSLWVVKLLLASTIVWFWIALSDGWGSHYHSAWICSVAALGSLMGAWCLHMSHETAQYMRWMDEMRLQAQRNSLDGEDEDDWDTFSGYDDFDDDPYSYRWTDREWARFNLARKKYDS